MIVYSTCTLNEIENEEVLAKIQEKYGLQITLITHKKYRPHRDKCGGFFLAKIQKISSVETQKTTQLPQKNPNFDFSDKLQIQIKSYLSDTFGIKKLSENALFYATTNAIYLTTKQYLDLHGKISLDKV